MPTRPSEEERRGGSEGFVTLTALLQDVEEIVKEAAQPSAIVAAAMRTLDLMATSTPAGHSPGAAPPQLPPKNGTEPASATSEVCTVSSTQNIAADEL